MIHEYYVLYPLLYRYIIYVRGIICIYLVSKIIIIFLILYYTSKPIKNKDYFTINTGKSILFYIINKKSKLNYGNFRYVF